MLISLLSFSNASPYPTGLTDPGWNKQESPVDLSIKLPSVSRRSPAEGNVFIVSFEEGMKYVMTYCKTFENVANDILFWVGRKLP